MQLSKEFMTAEASGDCGLYPLKVLTVDDDPGDSLLLKRMLEEIHDYSFDIRECSDIAYVKQSLKEFCPDVVFVDYFLGAATGIDLMESLSEKDRMDRAFVMLTGQGNEEIVAKALRQGVLDYQTKENLSYETLERTLRFVVQRLVDQRALKLRESILQSIAQAAASFLRVDNWRDQATHALAALGETAQSSHACLLKVLQTTDGERSAQSIFSWVSSDEQGEPNGNSFYPPSEIPLSRHICETLQSGEIVQKNISESDDPDALILRSFGVQTIVLAPIFVGNKWWGILELGESRFKRKWHDYVLDALHIWSDTLSAAIHSEKAEESLRLQATAIETAPSSICVTDPNGAVLWGNTAFARCNNNKEGEVKGTIPHIFDVDRQDDPLSRKLWQTICANRVWHGEFTDRQAEENPKTYEVTVSPVCNKMGELSHFVLVQHDITLRKELENKLRREAETDPLTDLPNRRSFKEHFTKILGLAQRSQTRAALIYLDLDGFKAVNDTLGHDAGDKLLCETAEHLKQSVRHSDTVARLGGDEFALILANIEKPLQAALVAEKLQHVIAAHPLSASQDLKVSASMGIAVFPEDARDADSLIKCADGALYRAKEAGRSTYRFHNKDFDTID